jgi:hypothetical protein
MAKIYFTGFVCDEDSQHLSDSFPSGYMAPLSQIGITVGAGSPDRAVLLHARDAGRIVITGNKSDFAQEMLLASKRCTPMRCVEGGGMITVPSGLPKLSYRKLERSLNLNGKDIDWPDVFTCNLHVDIHKNGDVLVKPLPVCDIFKKDHIATCERCQELGIGNN